jgi:small-conductance mechanosensitive channel
MAFDADTLERALATELLGNRAADWLEAAGITLALLLAALLVKRLLRRRFGRPATPAAAALAPGTAAQDLVQELMRRTRWVLLLLPAVFLGAQALVLSPNVHVLLRTLAVLALLLQVALWGTVGVEVWVSRTRRRRLGQDGGAAILIGSLNFIMRLVLWVLIALLALANLGVNVTALVAGLGVGGIAVALALQNILGDFLASLSIAADKPFELGDTIQIDSFVGTVEDVGWRTTRLRSLSGEQLIFANSDVLKSRIRNHKRMVERRVVLAFGVDYKTKADKVEQIPALLRAIVEAQPGVRFDRAHLKGFGQGSLDLEAVFYLTSPDYNLYMDAQQAILLALMRALEREGINLAQPDRTLWIAAETEPPVPRSTSLTGSTSSMRSTGSTGSSEQPAGPAVRS